MFSRSKKDLRINNSYGKASSLTISISTPFTPPSKEISIFAFPSARAAHISIFPKPYITFEAGSIFNSNLFATEFLQMTESLPVSIRASNSNGHLFILAILMQDDALLMPPSLTVIKL
ncbi:hypothetical protein CDAR_368011 [Caerostris darwini]|uniref:Uncharacterized protein n=1 Tax=Caerostris darwini TaxID=1538125 RepID=A0AAV4VXC1_9ARAC|nr:hypothetical protein CDAR_368011 [Caerostris darwini]